MFRRAQVVNLVLTAGVFEQQVSRQHTSRPQSERIEQQLLFKHQAPATVQLVERFFGAPVQAMLGRIVAGVGPLGFR